MCELMAGFWPTADRDPASSVLRSMGEGLGSRGRRLPVRAASGAREGTMRRRRRLLMAVGFFALAACPRAYARLDPAVPAAGRVAGDPAPAESPAVDILKRAMAGDRSVRVQSLAEVEAFLA